MDNFVVSARKYRPANFTSVVGQEHITSTLKNAIEREQLAHAYLFCGPRGVGKTTCARIFAKAINCMTPNSSEACNECESCMSFNDGRSMNIHELDAASNNSVDDIRTLIEQVRIIPQVGRYAVFIIDEVHMLSTAAFNAFLKTLEEPPAHAIFILATTEKHKIIPTILSRCQIYDFNRIRVEDSVRYLKYIAEQEKVSFDDESLNLIAQKADGGMRDALSMFDKAVSFGGDNLNLKQVAQTLNVLDYDTYFVMVETLLKGNYADALVSFDRVLSNGFSGQTFTSGMNKHTRDLLVAKNPQTLSLIEMTGSLLDRYQQQARLCSVDFLFDAISILTQIDGRMRQSSNQRLLIELGLMKIAGLGQKKNNDVGEAEYSLPELNKKASVVVSQPQAETKPQIQPPVVSVPQPQVEVQPAINVVVQTPEQTLLGRDENSEHQITMRSESMEVKKERAPSQEPAVVANVEFAKNVTELAPVPILEPIVEPAVEVVKPRARRKPMISGGSLSDLINTSSQTTIDDGVVEVVATNGVGVVVDADSEAKIGAKRVAILDYIKVRRPRFYAVFEFMEVAGNQISIKVPTSELRDEILRNKTEILMHIVEIASINGIITLNVEIVEQMQAVRPIKLEDKIKFMTDKNPLLMELKAALDLDVE